MKILLVEDDDRLSSRIVKALSRYDLCVDHIDNGIDAEILIETEDYDAIVLDLGLPGKPGLEVLKNLRNKGIDTPVLILTVRDSWHERVEGLRAGADDYMGKPFHVEELVERLKVLIRRAHEQIPGERIRCGDIELDESRKEVYLPDGRTVQLSGMEFRLLRLFMLNPGRVLSKDWLEEHTYDRENTHESNVIEAHIYRLRNIIGKERISTNRGQGYVFIKK